MAQAKRYPRELRERAVSMVFEIRGQSGQDKGAIARVAAQLGVGRETLRTWVLRSAAQAEFVTRAAVKPQVTTSRTGVSSDIA